MSQSSTRHTDGTLWVACVAGSPQQFRSVNIEGEIAKVYHPDATVIGDGNGGSDDHYECPHCKLTWWVENDG